MTMTQERRGSAMRYKIHIWDNRVGDCDGGTSIPLRVDGDVSIIVINEPRCAGAFSRV